MLFGGFSINDEDKNKFYDTLDDDTRISVMQNADFSLGILEIFNEHCEDISAFMKGDMTWGTFINKVKDKNKQIQSKNHEVYKKFNHCGRIQ